MPGIDDNFHLPADVIPLPNRLRDAGYFTANIQTIGGNQVGTGKTDLNFDVQGEDLQRVQLPRDLTDPAKITVPPYDPDDPVVRKDVFSGRDRPDEAVNRIRAVRTPRFRYIRNFMPEKSFTRH